MSQSLNSIAEILPNGASTIITASTEKQEQVFFVLAKKNSKTYIKEVPSKEAGKSYIAQLFGSKSKFCGKFTK